MNEAYLGLYIVTGYQAQALLKLFQNLSDTLFLQLPQELFNTVTVVQAQLRRTNSTTAGASLLQLGVRTVNHEQAPQRSSSLQ